MNKQSLRALILIHAPDNNESLINIYQTHGKMLAAMARPVTDAESQLPVRATCKFVDTTEAFSDAVYACTPRPDYLVYYTLGNDSLISGDSFEYMADSESIQIPVVTNPATMMDIFMSGPGEANPYSVTYPDNPFVSQVKNVLVKAEFDKLKPDNLFVVTTKAELDKLVDRCCKERFAADTETNFLNPFLRSITPRILCYSIAFMSDLDSGWCVPTNETHIEAMGCDYDLAYSTACLEKIFFESEQAKTFHNAQYDCVALYECYGKHVKNVVNDSMILVFLYHHTARPAGLAANTAMIGLPSYKDPIKEAIKSKKGKKSSGFEDIPFELLWPYAAMDALAVARLIVHLEEHMDESLWDLYYSISHNILTTSIDLAIDGWEVSKDRFYYTKKTLEEKMKDAYDMVLDLLDEHIDRTTFNLGSTAQLGDILFNKNKLGLTAFTTTASGAPATSEKAMGELLPFHPVIFRIIQYRKIGKLYNSYSTTLRNAIGPGSRHKGGKLVNRWVLQAQYRQVNRTSRLSNSNMEGHNGTKRRGGNILTLPGAGSFVKHFFAPDPVTQLENALFDAIIEKLTPEQQSEFQTWTEFDLTKDMKPVIPKKSSRKTKADTVNV